MSTQISSSGGPPPDMSEGTSQWLEEHLNIVRKRIVTGAKALAKQDSRQDIEPRDIAEAVKIFAPGIEISDGTSMPAFRRSLVERFLSWTPSITTVSAVLAIIFGVIGWKGQSASAFDIAKIFAGAVVGASGAAATKRYKEET